MKTNSIFKLVPLAICFLTFSCNDDDQVYYPSPQDNSISDVASRNDDFSILVDALVRADLVTTLDTGGPFTVFAPTNTAFQTFLSANGYADIDDVPLAALKEVLLNHVVSGEVRSSQLVTGYVKTLAKGSASSNTLSMYINTASGVVINGGAANGGATVTTADIAADNGVIHVVDRVIGLPTVVNHAIANPDFSILVQALTRGDQPDFVGVLSGDAASPFTVFAPTNTAFGNLLTELSLSGLADVPQATLENTLKYHVVTGANVLAADLSEGLSVATFQGGNFTVMLSGGAKITDANGRVSNIVATDVQGSNGVVHVVDKVLLPSL
ncbi:fasciclin domain-containing protein [Flavobacterium caeni]|uniref:Uncaracterized surface protein containing fasciclin (FAS1) repeats n=1 Tax=Flavobacterium caeni TaxID=490189 RepID=A0A1G5HRJ1_9FLAO|nr:fasciclin domain-containing protein [Flavobacterium caeni]SCY66344.1 Uncaracterized surface protein containing fasciclin (FAS1) repeats [Flavobacterium caeni]